MEDPFVHPFKWLRPDLFQLFPFHSCDPGLTPGGSGFCGILLKLMNYFGRLAYLSSAEAPGVMRILMPSGGLKSILHPCWTRWSCLLSLVTCSVREFTGKSAQLLIWMVGCWRELKALPVVWFDKLAKILSLMSEGVVSGVFSRGLSLSLKRVT